MNLTYVKNLCHNSRFYRWVERQPIGRQIGAGVAFLMFVMFQLLARSFSSNDPWNIVNTYTWMNALAAFMLAISWAINHHQYRFGFKCPMLFKVAACLVLASMVYGRCMPEFRAGTFPRIYMYGTSAAYLVSIPASFFKWNSGGVK